MDTVNKKFIENHVSFALKNAETKHLLNKLTLFIAQASEILWQRKKFIVFVHRPSLIPVA